MICMASSRSVLANRQVRVVIKCHKCTGETLVSQRKLKSTYSSSLETRDLIRRARGGARGRAFFLKSDDHRPTHAWMTKMTKSRARAAPLPRPPPRGAVLGDTPHPPCPTELGMGCPNAYVGPGILPSVSGAVHERFCPHPGH